MEHDQAYIKKVEEVAAELVRQSKVEKYGKNLDKPPTVIVRSLDSLEVDIEALAITLPKGWNVDVKVVGTWQRNPNDPPVDPQHDIAFARFFPKVSPIELE